MNQLAERPPAERRRTRILIAALVGTVALTGAYAMAANAAPAGSQATAVTASR